MNRLSALNTTRADIYTRAELLLYSENRVLCHLGDPEFEHGFGWNLHLLLRLGIKTRARLPLLLHQLAKTGQDKFTVLFNLFVGKPAKRIEEYSSGSFVGLGGFGKRGLKFCFGHLLESFMTAASDAFKEIVSPLLHPTLLGRDESRPARNGDRLSWHR